MHAHRHFATPTVPLRRRLALSAAVCLGLSLGTVRAAGEVSLSGDVKRPMTLDAAALRAFPADTNTVYRYARDMSEQPRPFTEYRGVRLMEVLEQAGLNERDALDWRKTVVIATGRGGERAVFSWAELANTAAGTEAMVAFERDRRPLAATDGPLAVHVPGDERSLARDVKQLQRIEVRIVRD